MDKESTFGGQDRTDVNSLTSGDLHDNPVGESPRVMPIASDATGTAQPPRTIDGLPARRIQLRYWVAMLALGLAIWAGIFFWLS
ncbi:MAG: hypothetical protein ACRCY3_08790 [Sphingorhabdus sp.]